MKCLILLHSATGNTRLMTRYAASCISRAGHECKIRDIVTRPKLPALGSVDLLGVSCPTMYFRPTFAMERFVARLPATAKPKPVFLLGTAAGEPGAHFSLLAEQLAHKGYVTLGAHWLLFPESWPPHLTFVKEWANGASYGEKLSTRYPALRPWVSILWPEVGVSNETDRDKLKRFIEEILLQASEFEPGKAPAFKDLHKPMPGANLAGRVMTVEMARQYTAVKIAPERCTKCGVCIKVCPAGCIARENEDDFPAFGPGCTGCWACFQHCPDQAISGWKAGPAEGQYPGPSKVLKERFKPLS